MKGVNLVRRVVSFFLLVCMLFTSASSSAIANSTDLKSTEKVSLSSLDEDESIEFLTNMGVRIPKEFCDKVDIGSWTKKLIGELESDPDRLYAISYTVASGFIEDVRKAVKRYHELSTSYDTSNGIVTELVTNNDAEEDVPRPTQPPSPTDWSENHLYT